jgi:hypothetical protein
VNVCPIRHTNREAARGSPVAATQAVFAYGICPWGCAELRNADIRSCRSSRASGQDRDDLVDVTTAIWPERIFMYPWACLSGTGYLADHGSA